jgi:hypothetical protein
LHAFTLDGTIKELGCIWGGAGRDGIDTVGELG